MLLPSVNPPWCFTSNATGLSPRAAEYQLSTKIPGWPQSSREFIAPAAIEYIKANKLRALAVTTATRFEGAPDIPTIGDAVPGYEASQWYGVAAPKSTPAEIVGKLNKEINAALNHPTMRGRLAELGGTPLSGTPTDFGRLMAADTEKWEKVVRVANIKPE
jgi:tripartite-type tricarboxylate transporter receptor subunit TctC